MPPPHKSQNYTTITVIIRNKKESSKKHKKAYQAKKKNVFISTKSLFFPGRCGHQNYFVPTKASHTPLQAYGVRILYLSDSQESHLFKNFPVFLIHISGLKND